VSDKQHPCPGGCLPLAGETARAPSREHHHTPSFIKAPIAQALDKGLAGESFERGGTGTPSPASEQMGQAIGGVVGEAIMQGTSAFAFVALFFELMDVLSSLLIPRAHGHEIEVGPFKAGAIVET
jgi:hypothetical protein